MATGPQAVGTSGAGGGGAVPPSLAVPFSSSLPAFGPFVPPLWGGFGFGFGFCAFGGCLWIGFAGGSTVTGGCGCGWVGGTGGSVVVVGSGSVVVWATAPGAAIAAPTTVAAIAVLIRPISQGPGRRATGHHSWSGSGAPR